MIAQVYLIYLRGTTWIVTLINQIHLLEKYSTLDDFCLVEFLAYYTLSCESKEDTSSDYQPNVFEDKLIEYNHDDCIYPRTIKLINSKKTMTCCKVERILVSCSK